MGSALDQLPIWAQDEIRNLRKGEGKYRTRAKELEESKTAELDAFKQQIGKALGLVEDDTDDPAKLLEAATKREQEIAAERDTYLAQIADYKRNEALNEIAKTAGVGDLTLLKGALALNNQYAQLDINADDYQAQVAEIVTQTLTSHPALAQVAHTSGIDTSTTNSGAARQITAEDLKNMSSREIYDAQKAGKLNHLL
ncbi:hypothetical protein cgR_p0013 (plasmid) [Corynebacterium glutamicum R]|uniref:Uncharacterized protein n=1 Tax=Corynebacterium glutamicum (strain R) TaxID=340322 RepID=A0AB72VEU0_CORGB|nr:hypothetical protein cgR_p0013 [Corynebacterium glutamicum R]